MNWTDATLNAIKRYTEKHNTLLIPRSELIAEEMSNIIRDTSTTGKTPESSLNYYLQKLRDAGQILFLERGRYLLVETSLNPDDYDLSDEELISLAEAGKLLFSAEESAAATVLQTRGKMQALRKAVLSNYREQCAICDVRSPDLLVTSHIDRWSDNPDARGDLSNVLCLCVFHDKLFELGFFYISDQLAIVRYRREADGKMIDAVFASTMPFRSDVNIRPSQRFLRRHRERIGIKED